jgi:hypothetical protein
VQPIQTCSVRSTYNKILFACHLSFIVEESKSMKSPGASRSLNREPIPFVASRIQERLMSKKVISPKIKVGDEPI